MILDDMKSHWQAAGASGTRSMSDTELLALIRRRSSVFDRMIRRRDLREMVGGIGGALLLAPALFRSSGLALAGAVSMVVAVVLLVGRLAHARRKHEGIRPHWPFVHVLRAERAKVDAQIELLESVLWWYIGPIAIGALMLVGGDLGLTRFTVGFGVAVVLFGWAVYRVNQRAVEHELRPRRNEITRLLTQVEGTVDQDES